MFEERRGNLPSISDRTIIGSSIIIRVSIAFVVLPVEGSSYDAYQARSISPGHWHFQEPSPSFHFSRLEVEASATGFAEVLVS